MHFNKTSFFSFLFCICCCIVSISYAADTLDYTLSRDKISLGETVTLSFILDAVSQNTAADFSPFEKDFRIVDRSYGRSISVINGSTKAQTFWQVTLEPKKAGELIIPEINFGSVKSSPRKIMVEENTQMLARKKSLPSAFVEAEISSSKPYVQSQVLYTFKIFYQSPLENSKLEPPTIKDGILIAVGEDKNYRKSINGEQFFVYEKNFVFFPQKTAKIVIPATVFRGLIYDNNSQSNSPYDFFSVSEPQPIALTSKSFTLDVQQIPDSFPGKIWLPAKNISLTEKWSSDSDQWELGNPITRVVTIEAQGLRADQIPDLAIDNISGVNIYADPPHRNNRFENQSLIGTLEQKITYIPNAAQTFTLPALKLDWWNTQTNTSAIAHLNSKLVQIIQAPKQINSSISGSTPSSSQIATLTNENKDPGLANEVNNIVIAKSNDAFYKSIWFWIAIFLLAIWLFTIWFIWKTKLAKSTKNVYLRDQKTIDGSIEWNEKDFGKACRNGDSVLAQKYLLLWGKACLLNPPNNLAQLREMIDDENFKKASEHLEQTLYANKTMSWNGEHLWNVYQTIKKNNKHIFLSLQKDKMSDDHKIDPLPPLNP